MIDRRELLVGGLAAVALPLPAGAALPIPGGNRLGFDVMRKGSKLGTHVLTFQTEGSALTVHVVVELVYKIMGMTLYHYLHEATETWAGDQVMTISSKTSDNGDNYQVTGKREAGGFAVQSNKAPRYLAPADAMPATHWNRRELGGPWINTQDGKLLRPRIAQGAVETVPASGGRSLPGRHYALAGDAKLDMWYDDRLGWTGLSFTRGGALIRYERQS